MTWLVLLDASVWAGWSIVVGSTVHAVRPSRFASDTWLTRVRSWEDDGRSYEWLAIRRWKDRLPEFGGKRTLPGSLETFALETRRAEYVHWTIAAAGPAFALWNPWWLTMAMLAYAVGGNAPFIVVQRYNRARVLRILRRRMAVPR